MKKIILPDDFILVIDTREQNPLFIKRHTKGLIIVKDKLNTGDYSIRGFENKIAIERKSIPDLYNCMTRDRERFIECLKRLSLYDRRWIVIEGTEEEVLNPQDCFSNIHPNSIKGGIVSIETRYFVPIYYAKNRSIAEEWILNRLIKYYNIVRESKQNEAASKTD